MKQKPLKQLSYEVMVATPVIVDPEIQDRITIWFDGKPVDDLSYILFTLRNSGNQPIQVDDYPAPIKFSFGEEARVLAAELWKPGAEVYFKRYSKSVLLKPTLASGKRVKSEICCKYAL